MRNQHALQINFIAKEGNNTYFNTEVSSVNIVP